MTITKSLILESSVPVTHEVVEQSNEAMERHDVLAFSQYNKSLVGKHIECDFYVEDQPGIDPTPKALKALSELEWITQVVIKNLDEE